MLPVKVKGQAPQRIHDQAPTLRTLHIQCFMRYIRRATKRSFFNAFSLSHHFNPTPNLVNSFSVHARCELQLRTPQAQFVRISLARHNRSFQSAVTCRSNWKLAYARISILRSSSNRNSFILLLFRHILFRFTAYVYRLLFSSSKVHIQCLPLPPALLQSIFCAV